MPQFTTRAAGAPHPLEWPICAKLEALRTIDPRSRHVQVVGSIPYRICRLATRRPRTELTVISPRQLRHILADHPDVAGDLNLMSWVIADPDYAAAPGQRATLLLARCLSPTQCYVIAVRFRDRGDRQKYPRNNVITFHRLAPKKLEAWREAGQLVWEAGSR